MTFGNPYTVHKMVRVGITGGIACGKSEVAVILSTIGVSILDTDDVVHELQRPGEAGFSAIVDWLGDEIVDEAGELNRLSLAEMVFSDPAARDKLNSLLHPLVKVRCEEWLKDEGDRALVVPLLFEVGWNLGLDAVVCVRAPEMIQMARLRKRGLSAAEAGQRIAAQMPQSEKAAMADFVIDNNDDLRALRTSTCHVWKNIMEMIHDGK